ncbi:MAG: alpha/beta hydrolase [Pseudomonadota bacterium]
MAIHEKLNDLKIGSLTGRNGFLDNRPNLVMIHGAGGNARVWQNQISLLDKTLNVLALDLPGHGKTPAKGYDSIAEHTRWLGDVIEALFEEPIFLMGHSMGGAIVQEAAFTYPDLLKGIILVSTGPRLRVAPMLIEGILDNFEQTVDTVMRYAYSLKTDKTIIAEGAKLMKSAGADIVHVDFLACDEFDSRQDLNHIHLPCLVICGNQDKMTPLKLSETLHQNIEESILKTIPNAGHMVMIERYRELNEAALEFIMGLEA